MMIDEMYTLTVVACDCSFFALRPCLLRANVIKSPITNASLQASAAAVCSMVCSLPFRESPTTGKHNVAFVCHLGCSPVAETVLRFSLPAAAPLTRFHPQTVCTIIVFSLSNSACVIFELTMVINQVIWHLMLEATLPERQKSLHMGTHVKPPNHNEISSTYNRCTIIASITQSN